jgi:hypothetical protein
VIGAVAFLLVAIALCALSCLAIVAITHREMSGSSAIERDGLHRGVRAPSWSLVDPSEQEVRSPPASSLQLIVFADHSLRSFPLLVEALTGLANEVPPSELEMVVLLREKNDIVEPVLRLLGLGDIPVVTGSPALYARYNVRVMPWVMVIDSAGRVRCSSLVTNRWEVEKLWQLANVRLAEERPSLTRLRRLRPAARA